MSQTQPDDEAQPLSYEDGINEIILGKGTNINDIASHVNVQLDGTYDVLSAELHTIVDHIYLFGIIEFQVKYTN